MKWRGYCAAYDEGTEPSADDMQLIHTKKAPQLLAEPNVNSIRFAGGDQRAYFDEWAALSVGFLSGGLAQARLWTTTMPQVTLDETPLRYGAMAVGALRKAQTRDTPDGRHYLNAVIYYCEALRLQAKAKPSREGLRTALLSSLLFICFETQRGNVPAALKHITHGFSMLNELASCTDAAPGLVSMAPAPPALVQEILDCYKPLELQSRSFMGSYKKFFFKSDATPPSPASTPSQTGLPSPQSTASPPSASASASASPRRFPGIAPFTKHSPYFRPKQTSITSLDELPAAFQDLDQAQGYWSLVQKAMVGHLPMLTMTTSRLELHRTTSEAELDEKLSSVKKMPKMARFIAEVRYWLQRWVEALDPLYRAVCRAADKQAYLAAINLRVEYLILYIYTTVPRFSGIVAAKGLTPQYRELNALCEELLAARPSCGFAMDSGWTWPLFISSFSCRDEAVRADAIRILGQYPIRNALRDSRVFRAIALRNQDVEAQVAAEGTEHEQWLRLRRREVVFEDFGASVIYRSAQKVDGRWELVEEAAAFAVDEDGRLHWQRQDVSDSASILSGVC